jgi:hypothetical protein
MFWQLAVPVLFQDLQEPDCSKGTHEKEAAQED